MRYSDKRNEKKGSVAKRKSVESTGFSRCPPPVLRTRAHRKSGISEFRTASVRMCPEDPRRSRSGMDTRPGNGRCDNLVCTVGVYLNFIGGLAVTWPYRSGGGGDAAGGFLFRFIGSGTRRRSSRFPEGTLPSDQYRSSSSVTRALSHSRSVSTPVLP